MLPSVTEGHGFIGLSIVLVLNAAIAAAYYLRLITAMLF